MTTQKILDRTNQLIELANSALASRFLIRNGLSEKIYLRDELFSEFRSSSLSFILNIYGEKHPLYIDFSQHVTKNIIQDTHKGRGILNSIKSEIENDWLLTLKGIIASEFFSNFIDMADHLLKEGYKDPAAVIIGSVLEEHLRQLCLKNELPIEYEKDGKLIPKKVDSLNSELAVANIYNKLDQKSVTAWLDLRNKAAHGKYDEYNKQQVKFMLHTVTEFISRNSL